MRYILVLTFFCFILTKSVSYKITCSSTCDSDFYNLIHNQGIIIYDKARRSYVADHLIMPGLATFLPEGGKELEIELISKKGWLDSEMSYIYPSLIRNIISLYKKKFDEQNNDNNKKIQEKQNEIEAKDEKGLMTVAKMKSITKVEDGNNIQKDNNIKISNDVDSNSPERSKNLRGISSINNPNQSSEQKTSSEKEKESEKNQDSKSPISKITSSLVLSTEPTSKISEEAYRAKTLVPSENLSSTTSTSPVKNSILFEPPSFMFYNQLNNILHQISGVYYIYTFSSSCLKCLDKIFYLTKILPNLVFKLYYTNIYDNITIEPEYFTNRQNYQLRNSFYYKDCKKVTNAFIREQKDVNSRTFNPFYNCVESVYTKIVLGEKNLNRISFKNVKLRKDMSYLYATITDTY